MNLGDCCLGTVFAYLGIFYVSWTLLKVALFVYRQFLRPGTNYDKYKSKEPWALVTGCTDGLGLEYARQLAAKGFNVFLVSRSQAKLEDVARELESEHGVATAVLAMDFAQRDRDRATAHADWARLAQQVKSVCKKNLGVLVNNAGLGDEWPEKFLDAEPDRQRDILAVNVNAAVEVVRALMPLMIAGNDGGRRRSLLINVSSGSSLNPAPMLGVYGAGKTFLSSWSTVLALEYAKDGVDVDAPTPFFVVSKLSKRRRPTLTIPTARRYVMDSLAHAGHGDYFSVNPYWAHALMGAFLQWFPFKALLLNQIFKMHKAVRTAAMKKAAKSK